MNKLYWGTAEVTGIETVFQRKMEIRLVVKLASHWEEPWKPIGELKLVKNYIIKPLKLLKYSTEFIKYAQNIYYTDGIMLGSARDPAIFKLNKNPQALLIETQSKPRIGSKVKPHPAFLHSNPPNSILLYLLGGVTE